jgi:hypothetical protein
MGIRAGFVQELSHIGVVGGIDDSRDRPRYAFTNISESKYSGKNSPHLFGVVAGSYTTDTIRRFTLWCGA